MKKLLLFLFFGLFLFTYVEMEAQIISEAAARAEIRKRGLDEDEVLRELEKKGIDLDNIDLNNPTELAKAETALREVIAELEAQKTAGISTSEIPLEELTKEEAKVIAKESEEVVEAVEGGATLEEAVAETLQEAQEEKLPLATTYGQEIFRNKSISLYRQSDNVRPPNTYVLGPGDKIAVNIWGISEESSAFDINSEGFIKPSRLPRIYLTGLTIEEAKNRLKSFYSRSYRFRDEDFDVTLSTARTITVNIVGEVENSGSFTISALNTAFNALVAAGGPTKLGSVRNIQLISGSEIKEIDVYAFLKNPSVSQSLYLKDGDYINVPVARKVISVAGAVNRPTNYELKDEEGLNKLIEYAAGLTNRAIKKTIRVIRIENDNETLIDVPYSELIETNKDFELRSGDRVEVFTVPNEYNNVVELSGAFLLPGEYAYKEGMKIYDLINKTEIIEGAKLDSAYLRRENADGVTVTYQIINLNDVINDPSSQSNINLQARDLIYLRSNRDFVNRVQISVEGDVRNPGVYEVDRLGSLKVSDLIFLSGGLNDSANEIGFIFRRNPENPLAPEYLRVNVKEAVKNPESVENIFLVGGDRLTIYPSSRYIDQFSVRISGAVRSPGEFEFDPSLNINDLIILAGGLSVDASPSRVEVFRVQFEKDKETEILAATLQLDENNRLVNKDFSLQPFDLIYVRSAPEFELQRIVNVLGEVKYPGQYVILDDNETINSIIKRAGGVTKEAFLEGASLFRNKDSLGYVVFDFKEAMLNSTSNHNIIIQDGDSIQIPKMQKLVTIIGATKAIELYSEDVVNSGRFNVPFEPGKNAKYYIDKFAGGIAKNGDAGKVSVTYANGEIQKSGRFLFWRKYPNVKEGSIIKVGVKDVEPPKTNSENQDVNWGEVLADTVAQATAILSLVLLLQRVD